MSGMGHDRTSIFLNSGSAVSQNGCSSLLARANTKMTQGAEPGLHRFSQSNVAGAKSSQTIRPMIKKYRAAILVAAITVIGFAVAVYYVGNLLNVN